MLCNAPKELFDFFKVAEGGSVLRRLIREKTFVKNPLSYYI